MGAAPRYLSGEERSGVRPGRSCALCILRTFLTDAGEFRCEILLAVRFFRSFLSENDATSCVTSIQLLFSSLSRLRTKPFSRDATNNNLQNVKASLMNRLLTQYIVELSHLTFQKHQLLFLRWRILTRNEPRKDSNQVQGDYISSWVLLFY